MLRLRYQKMYAGLAPKGWLQQPAEFPALPETIDTRLPLVHKRPTPADVRESRARRQRAEKAQALRDSARLERLAFERLHHEASAVRARDASVKVRELRARKLRRADELKQRFRRAREHRVQQAERHWSRRCGYSAVCQTSSIFSPRSDDRQDDPNEIVAALRTFCDYLNIKDDKLANPPAFADLEVAKVQYANFLEWLDTHASKFRGHDFNEKYMHALAAKWEKSPAWNPLIRRMITWVIATSPSQCAIEESFSFLKRMKTRLQGSMSLVLCNAICGTRQHSSRNPASINWDVYMEAWKRMLYQNSGTRWSVSKETFRLHRDKSKQFKRVGDTKGRTILPMTMDLFDDDWVPQRPSDMDGAGLAPP